MNRSISNTAEYGEYVSGSRLIEGAIRHEGSMADNAVDVALREACLAV